MFRRESSGLREAKALLANLTFKVCAVSTSRGVEFDCSTLPAFLYESPYLQSGQVSINAKVCHIHEPSPPGGYQIRYGQDESVFQGIGLGLGFFYPASDSPEFGLAWYPTRQEAIDCIYMALGTERSGIDPREFYVERFDHNLESALYNLGKWRHVFQDRPVRVCPACGVTNVEPKAYRVFTCRGCLKQWDGAYCPLTGIEGYCQADCACWEYTIDPDHILRGR
jgi:hypothetical protein